VNGTVIEQTDLFIFVLLFHFLHVASACTKTVIAKMSIKQSQKYFLIVAKTDRDLQPFMLVMILQPIGGFFKRCCCCNRARQLYKNISMLFLFPVKTVSLVQASIHNVSYISLQ